MNFSLPEWCGLSGCTLKFRHKGFHRYKRPKLPGIASQWNRRQPKTPDKHQTSSITMKVTRSIDRLKRERAEESMHRLTFDDVNAADSKVKKRIRYPAQTRIIPVEICETCSAPPSMNDRHTKGRRKPVNTRQPISEEYYMCGVYGCILREKHPGLHVLRQLDRLRPRGSVDYCA